MLPLFHWLVLLCRSLMNSSLVCHWPQLCPAMKPSARCCCAHDASFFICASVACCWSCLIWSATSPPAWALRLTDRVRQPSNVMAQITVLVGTCYVLRSSGAIVHLSCRSRALSRLYPAALRNLRTEAGRPGVLILMLAPPAAAVAFLAQLLVLVREFLQFIVREVFDVDHLVLRLIDRLDDFIELQVDGAGIAVLRVLDQEHHEERDDSRAGVDDELPGIRVMEIRPGDKPQRDDEQRR